MESESNIAEAWIANSETFGNPQRLGKEFKENAV